MTYKPDKIRLKCALIALTQKRFTPVQKRPQIYDLSHWFTSCCFDFSCVILVQFKVDCFIRDILIARSEIARGERLVRAQLLFVVGVWWGGGGGEGRGDVPNSWGTFYSQSLNPCCLLFIVNIHHVANLERSLLCHVTQLPLRGGFWWCHVKICLFPR